MNEDWGVYVHVPWCRVRCPYCAFYVQPDRDANWPRWTEGIIAEYEMRKHRFPGRPSTVYLGGGTPSRLPIDDLEHLRRSIDLAPDGEFTAEANPEDVDEQWLSGAIAAGVNRVSLGIQTFNTRFARLLNRAHSVDQAREVASMVSGAGLQSWSVDVIFALPDQTLADLEVDIAEILAIEPPHVSLYGLTIEPGTPFERARDLGRLKPLDDELWRQMYDTLVSRLEAAGLHRYEVSNFARTGHQSRHNRGYWRGHPYMGLGPSAHGFRPDGSRYSNVKDARAYGTIDDPTEYEESPSRIEADTDLLISALRSVEGIQLSALTTNIRPSAIDDLVRGGLLSRDGDRLALTPEGFPIADAVMNRLVEALQVPNGVEKDS